MNDVVWKPTQENTIERYYITMSDENGKLSFHNVDKEIYEYVLKIEDEIRELRAKKFLVDELFRI